MSKPATLSDEAYAALQAHKTSKRDSLSSVILRHIPKPIRTFGDLEEHLRKLDGPVITDETALDRLRRRKGRSGHAH